MTYSLRVGAAEIRRVEEFTHKSAIATLTRDQALIDANKHWLIPRFLGEDGYRDFVFQSWILLVDDKVFVIDPCNGNGRPHMYPMFANLSTPYIERFEATGIKPQDVDYVFCTHLHHDHCGWSTQLRAGRFVPTFPNARYVYVRREYERWDPGNGDIPDFMEASRSTASGKSKSGNGDIPNFVETHRSTTNGKSKSGMSPFPTVDYNAGVFEHSVLPIMEAGLAELVADRHRLSPGVAIEPSYGHTLGHSMLHLVSQTREAYFTGDVFHHPLQMLYPELHMPGCDDLPMAIATRRRVIEQCIEHDALVVPAHFPAPYAGWIRRRDGVVAFEPVGDP